MLMENLKVLRKFVKDNKLNRQNPMYRYKALDHKYNLQKKYTSKVLEQGDELLREVGVIEAQALSREGLYLKELEKEVKNHWLVNEVNQNISKYVDEKGVLLNYDEANKAFKELNTHAENTGLPKSFLSTTERSFKNIFSNGIPTKSEAEGNMKKLTLSLKTLSEAINYERFEDLSLEDLNSRIKYQNYLNYYYHLKKLFSKYTVIPLPLSTPTKSNFESYSSLIEQYKMIDPSERSELLKIDLLELYIHDSNYYKAYSILKENSKFLEFIEGAEKDLESIEDFLVYKLLTEITHMQNLRELNIQK